jgi:hypothetical protein
MTLPFAASGPPVMRKPAPWSPIARSEITLPVLMSSATKMGVRGGDEQAVAIKRQISLDARQRLLRQRARVFPEQVSRGSFECLDVVAESADQQDTIVNQRRHFIRSGSHAKITGIGPVGSV